MEHRQLGRSGLKIPAICLGTATFGGEGEFFKAWGNTNVAEAKRLIDICIEAGLNFFDSADGYSKGLGEDILGQALAGRRQHTLISTKATIASGDGPNDGGSSRFHLLRACEASLRRLRTDYIDIYHMHVFDAVTPVEETLRTLEDLIRSGKIRYIACSNYSGWHLMKALGTSERLGLNRYVAHQAYYSLIGRDYEWELMPLAKDQGLATIVWSPLAGGALTGKIRRGKAAPADSRIGQLDFIPYDEPRLFNIVDVLDAISKETGKTIPQIALNWVLQRPTVASIVIGARNENQLRQNLGSIGWNLTEDQMLRLDAVSDVAPPYPYWHQRWFPQLNPPLFEPKM